MLNDLRPTKKKIEMNMDYRTQVRRLSEIVNKHIAVFSATDSTITTTEYSGQSVQ
jgi:hypothetical protein